jgi:hypothetical protein
MVADRRLGCDDGCSHWPAARGDWVSLDSTVVAPGRTGWQCGGRQAVAMSLSIAAATSAGCSSATQCPLSAMMLVSTL